MNSTTGAKSDFNSTNEIDKDIKKSKRINYMSSDNEIEDTFSIKY